MCVLSVLRVCLFIDSIPVYYVCVCLLSSVPVYYVYVCLLSSVPVYYVCVCLLTAFLCITCVFVY